MKICVTTVLVLLINVHYPESVLFSNRRFYIHEGPMINIKCDLCKHRSFISYIFTLRSGHMISAGSLAPRGSHFI